MRFSIIGSRQAWRFTGAVVVALVLGACSGDDEPQAESGAQKSDHVWKEQTGAIDKARDVGRQIGAAAARQEEAARKAAQ